MDCVHHFYSEFAFVLYDSEIESYFAARDIAGTRPLHYTIQNNQFYYSDDIGELLSQSGMKKEPDIDVVHMLIQHNTIPYSRTLYKDIKRLPPGHFMTVDKDMQVAIRRYWKPEDIQVSKSISEQEAKERFLEIFNASVLDRIDDLKTTSFDLSGGLDSSSVVSATKHLFPQERIQTVSKIYENMPSCDESEYIDSMLDKYDLESTKINLDKLDYKDKYTLKYRYDLEPYWPMLVTHTMGLYVAEKLQDMGIKRVITGQGGDQLMGGSAYSLNDYLKHFQWLQLYRELSTLKRPLKMFKMYALLPLLNDRSKKLIKKILRPFDKHKVLPKKTFKELCDQCPKDSLAFWHDIDSITSTNQSLVFDISYHHVVYKHYGIRAYHPFYDRRLMEFMLSLPAKFKYSEGVIKVLLRKAMEGILPEKIQQRRDKAEFTAVIKQQIDAIDLDELLGETHLGKLGLMEQTEVDKLKEDYQSGKMKTVAHFWKVINMEYWYRYNFVDNKEIA